jgi:N-acylglucosamine-6-phosphate 2-epimerase
LFNIEKIWQKLLVSCQPEAQESFYDTAFVTGMAQAAMLGGAGGLRLSGPENIIAVKQFTDAPVIGIWKQKYPDSEVYITPTLKEALALLEAGADIIALDATQRPRPQEALETIVEQLKGKVCLMADISCLEEALWAEQLGFDCIGSTLAGYTEATRHNLTKGPDFALLKTMAQHLHTPVIAEGRISTPEEASRALELGAHAVVVGSAITRPQVITRAFLAKMNLH